MNEAPVDFISVKERGSPAGRGRNEDPAFGNQSMFVGSNPGVMIAGYDHFPTVEVVDLSVVEVGNFCDVKTHGVTSWGGDQGRGSMDSQTSTSWS